MVCEATQAVLGAPCVLFDGSTSLWGSYQRHRRSHLMTFVCYLALLVAIMADIPKVEAKKLLV